MRQRTLAVVSAGLSVPSSTRLLADRLSAAAQRAAADRGVQLVPEVIEPGQLGDRRELRTLGGQTVSVEAGDPIRVGGAEVVGDGMLEEDVRVAVYTVDALVEVHRPATCR